MLSELIRKEIREILLSRKFAVTFGVMAVLTLLAFYSGALNYKTSLANYEAAVEGNRSQLDNLTREFRVVWQVFLRPQPLQAVVSGVSNDVGRSVFVGKWSTPSPRSSRFEEEPIYAVFRLLDLEFVVTVALSLFAIMFAFDSISGEKEKGTLALLLSNAVPRDNIILGKLIGSFVALGIPMLIPVLVGVLLLPVLGVSVTGGEILRLGLILVGAGLYLGVFLSVSTLASCLTRRSSHAFLILLVVWILSVQILPRVLGGVSSRQVPVTSYAEIREQDWKMRRARWREATKRVEALRAEGDENAWDQYLDIVQELEKRDAPVLERLIERRRNEFAHRSVLALNLSRVSPASVFKITAATLAGTSPQIEKHFYEQARQYKQTWTEFVEQYQPDFSRMSMEERSEPLVLDSHPEFRQWRPPIGSVMASASVDLGILAVYNVLLFGAAVLAFRRYDVR
jgi:ABC-2 type transport system permease protein